MSGRCCCGLALRPTPGKDIPIKTLSKHCNSVEIQDHLQLFRDMTEYHSRDRISAETALEHYRELQSNNKYKSVFQ